MSTIDCGGIGAGALERAGADLAGGLSRDGPGRAGDVVVALLLGVVEKDDVEQARVDLAVGTELDRLVVAAEDVIALQRR